MTTLTLEFSPELYERLRAEAERQGKPARDVVREWLVERLATSAPMSERERATEALRAAGLLTELSPEEKRRTARSTATLEEVGSALDRAGGKPLSGLGRSPARRPGTPSCWRRSRGSRRRSRPGIARPGASSRDEAIALLLEHHDAEYRITPLNRTIVSRAVSLTQNHRLRGYDAIQFATTLAANGSLVVASLPTLTFVADDEDLVTAAHVEALAADDPNRHR